MSCNMVRPTGAHWLALKFVSLSEKGAPTHFYTRLRGFAESRWPPDRTTRCPEEATVAQQLTYPLLTRQDAIRSTESNKTFKSLNA